MHANHENIGPRVRHIRIRDPGRRRESQGAEGGRQAVGELRKVIWPTRNELVTYTAAALAFIIVMSAIVLSLDYGFTKLMFWVF